MQVEQHAIRSRSGHLRTLLLVIALVLLGVGAVGATEVHTDTAGDLIEVRVAAVTLAVLATRFARRSVPPRRTFAGSSGAAAEVIVRRSVPRGHPASRRGPPWSVSPASTCA